MSTTNFNLGISYKNALDQLKITQDTILAAKCLVHDSESKDVIINKMQTAYLSTQKAMIKIKQLSANTILLTKECKRKSDLYEKVRKDLDHMHKIHPPPGTKPVQFFFLLTKNPRLSYVSLPQNQM